MSPTIAIDFGSSRTKVAYFCTDLGKPKIIELGQEVRSIIPSVFYIPRKGSVLIGDDAAQMADEDPTGIVTDIKRDLHRPSKIRCGEGRPAYLRSELVSHLFREIRRRCGEEVFHTGPSSDCILTVPVCFSEPQRQKLREAAERAGFTNVRLLEEPIAAAMHWLSSSGKSVSDHVIVVDIGGGTIDLAALKLSGETYEPIPDLPPRGFGCGGNDIDEDVRRVVQKDFACSDEDSGGLLLKLRQVKERLVKTDRDVFSVSLIGRTQAIQRTVVEAAVRTLVEKTCNEVTRFLNDFEEVTGRKDTPVLLAGGGSKLVGMKEALKKVAGSDRVFIWNDGEYAIALGAALACASNRSTLPSAPLHPEIKINGAGNSPDIIYTSSALNQLQAILTSPIIISATKQREIITLDMFTACELEAKRGNAMAQFLLGCCYEEGFQVSKSLDQALCWFKQSSNQGNAFGNAGFAQLLLVGKGVHVDESEAFRLFCLSAYQDNWFGQSGVGICYLSGRGVLENRNEAVKWFRLAANHGVTVAQFLLGCCYMDGAGVSQNDAEAVEWFRLAAEQGNADSQYKLGCCYLNGQGVFQNAVEAVKWFRLAADQGDEGGFKSADAVCSLGYCYFNGLGVSQDYVEAVKWYNLAAHQAHAVAQHALGCCYLNGQGVSQDAVEAVKWFRLAADQGDEGGFKSVDAVFSLGYCYSNGLGVSQDHVEAVKWYNLAAHQAHALAQQALGYCYLNGQGVSQDAVEAVKWFRLAADQGDEGVFKSVDAVFSLGYCYSNGLGVSQDHVEAVKWYNLAAHKTHAAAQQALGYCYLNGQGVSQNRAKAVEWFLLAAEQGLVDAQTRLGECYLKGWGGSQNHSEAVEWFRRATDSSAEAQYFIGHCFRYGFGVTRDRATALMWFWKAADLGHVEAQKSLNDMTSPVDEILDGAKDLLGYLFPKEVDIATSTGYNSFGELERNVKDVYPSGRPNRPVD